MARKKKGEEPQTEQILTENDPMNKFGVKSQSKKIKKREALIRILVIILVILLLFLSVMFACSSYINKAGDFTVTMNKDAFNVGLSLSETADFTKPTRFLAGDKCDNMGDCTLDWIPQDVDSIDGSHNKSNGEEFLAYTFYVKNAGQKDVGYNAYISIDSVAMNADDAMRVMVFKNGEPTIYAKPKKGTTNVLENNEGHYNIDKNFATNTKVMDVANNNFKIGSVDKYTVVIWLEGWDPECVNDILDGEVKLSMTFNGYELEGSGGVSES